MTATAVLPFRSSRLIELAATPSVPSRVSVRELSVVFSQGIEPRWQNIHHKAILSDTHTLSRHR